MTPGEILSISSEESQPHIEQPSNEPPTVWRKIRAFAFNLLRRKEPPEQPSPSPRPQKGPVETILETHDPVAIAECCLRDPAYSLKEKLATLERTAFGESPEATLRLCRAVIDDPKKSALYRAILTKNTNLLWPVSLARELFSLPGINGGLHEFLIQRIDDQGTISREQLFTLIVAIGDITSISFLLKHFGYELNFVDSGRLRGNKDHPLKAAIEIAHSLRDADKIAETFQDFGFELKPKARL